MCRAEVPLGQRLSTEEVPPRVAALYLLALCVEPATTQLQNGELIGAVQAGPTGYPSICGFL